MLGNLIEIIRDTGREVSKSRLQSVDGGKWEGDQLKTQADALAHKLLAMKLSDVLPIPVVSEENSFSQSEVRPDKYWLIDPIDGTRSLVDGFPGWVIQAALIQNNEPQIAVIFAPDLDLTFTAEKGEGRFVTAENCHLIVPIRVDCYLLTITLSQEELLQICAMEYLVPVTLNAAVLR